MVNVKGFFLPSCGFLSELDVSGMIMSYSGSGRCISSAFLVEAELTQLIQKLVYGKGLRGESQPWINLLEVFEAFLFGLAPLCPGGTQEVPARPIHVFSKKERTLKDRKCEFHPRCFGRKSAVKRTQTIRAYAGFVYLQKPVVGVPVHWCSAINNKGRQQLATCLL